MFIGITCKSSPNSLYLPRKYIESIESNGGEPLLIPHINKFEYIEEISNLLAGILFAGGGDIEPKFYKEERMGELKRVDEKRDAFEIKLLQRFFKNRKPVLGICRGMQVLNVALGGTLYQDIEKITPQRHWQKNPPPQSSHEIEIMENTTLYKIFKTKKLMVNSFHHQAIKELGEGFLVSAKAKDNIIEAIEHKEHPFMLGVQFHPEYMYEKEPFKNLFKYFVEKCLRG